MSEKTDNKAVQVPDPDIAKNNKQKGAETSEECNLLNENILKKTFPFTPLISLIICFAIFIYILISAESVADAKSTLGPETIIILLLIGYSIILFNAFFNHQSSTAGKYYDRVIHQSPNKLVKTLVTLESLLTTPVDKIQCTVLKRWVEYYNYPFNYVIYASSLIVACVMLMAYIQSAKFKFGDDDLSPGNVDVDGNRCNEEKNRIKYNMAVKANSEGGPWPFQDIPM